jgi:hypothetical protein
MDFSKATLESIKKYVKRPTADNFRFFNSAGGLRKVAAFAT